jgi:hypothetical protein
MLMLRLRSAGTSRAIGPSDWIQLRGTELFTSIDPVRVAHYETGDWIHGQTRSVGFECRAILSIQFEDPAWGVSPMLGPFPVMHVRDRFIFGGRMRLAKLSPAEGRWVPTGSDKGWRIVHVRPGSPPKGEPLT